MGGKISNLSCAGCRRKQARYGVHGHHASSVRPCYHDSYYDAIGGRIVASQRRRLGSTRTNRQASLNLLSLTQAEVQPPNRRNLHHFDEALPAGCYVEKLRATGERCCSADKMIFKDGDGRFEDGTCPDMSTISMVAGSIPGPSIRSSLAQLPPTSVCTPRDARSTDNVLCGSRVFPSDITDTTLVVPPNSVNSQFLSGVSPFSSDDEQSFDSVFDSSQDILRFYHHGYFPPSTFLINNNNAILRNQYREFETENGKKPGQLEGSDGPGLDSDFGASAGVEMKIVSSDNNTVGERTPTLEASEWKVWRPLGGGKKMKNSARKLSNDPPNSNNSSSSRLFQSHRPHHAPQSCPILGPDTSLLHVTMEWDPYDPTYARNNWMEYVIPGVTYPPLPKLDEQQYWL